MNNPPRPIFSAYSYRKSLGERNGTVTWRATADGGVEVGGFAWTYFELERVDALSNSRASSSDGAGVAPTSASSPR